MKPANKRNKKINKSKNVDKHCLFRCLQRLGYYPNMEELITLIQQGKLPLYDKQSNRVTRWKWIDPINKVSCILPYDKIRKQIITILFEDIENLKV